MAQENRMESVSPIPTSDHNPSAPDADEDSDWELKIVGHTKPTVNVPSDDGDSSDAVIIHHYSDDEVRPPRKKKRKIIPPPPRPQPQKPRKRAKATSRRRDTAARSSGNHKGRSPGQAFLNSYEAPASAMDMPGPSTTHDKNMSKGKGRATGSGEVCILRLHPHVTMI